MNQINFGTCANTGNDAFIMSNLVAGADGTASVTSTVNATLASLQDGNHLLHTHRGAGAQEGGIVACGNIPVAAAVTATASPSAAVTTTPTARATVAAATAVVSATPSATTTAAVTVTASPTATPSAGGMALPLAPAGALGGSARASVMSVKGRE